MLGEARTRKCYKLSKGESRSCISKFCRPSWGELLIVYPEILGVPASWDVGPIKKFQLVCSGPLHSGNPVWSFPIRGELFLLGGLRSFVSPEDEVSRLEELGFYSGVIVLCCFLLISHHADLDCLPHFFDEIQVAPEFGGVGGCVVMFHS